MKTYLLAGITAVALTVGAGAAHAGLMTIANGVDGATFGSVPSAGTNQALPIFFPPLPDSGPGYGWYGAIITGTAGATYTFDVFGAEAGFANRFSVDGSTVYTHAGGNNLSLAIKATYTGSTLNFSFLTNTTNSGSPASTLITNDLSATGNTNDTSGNRPNFFATIDALDATDGGGRTGNVIWLFLDDSNQVDDNHDDLVVRITATIPEPATLGLLGVGLIGLGLAARRRRKAA